MKSKQLFIRGALSIVLGIGLSYYNTNFIVLCAVGLMVAGIGIIYLLEEHEK